MYISKLNRSLAFFMCAGVLSACNASPVPQQSTTSANEALAPIIQKKSLTIATWNAEHLAFPISDGCRPRNEQEIVKLQAYARSLNADIVALQEVASREAIAAVFSEDEWQILVSSRPDSKTYDCRGSGLTSTQQKVAYAVRKEVEVLDIDTLADFGLANPGLRHGLELTVATPLGKLKLLNVHMKSGCFVDSYEKGARDGKEACISFAQQTDMLVDWVEKQQNSQIPVVLLGDFNHRLSAPYNQLTQRLMQAGESTIGLENTSQSLIGCHPYYPAPIDHIWVGRLSDNRYQKSAQVHHYDDMSVNAMLSDHCALTLELSEKPWELSNGVTWQTTSAEYRYLTQSIYQNATKTLKAMAKPKGAWSVVMDVDETILDNSAYNVLLEQTGAQYSRDSWNAWVASEQATLVPGAKAFIDSVFEQGGKLALVTNRERPMDKHTWRNLESVGIGLSLDNSCLLGRVAEDKKAIGNKGIINDKDLRRQQIALGQASCFDPTNEGRHNSFAQAKILMQVGDNIEDFATVTQEEAKPKELIKDKSLVLLPNTMYGSW